MAETIYPKPSKVLADKRKALAPEIVTAFRRFSDVVFRDGTLPRKTKQLITVAVAHVAQCPYCIQGHTKAASHHPGLWGKGYRSQQCRGAQGISRAPAGHRR